MQGKWAYGALAGNVWSFAAGFERRDVNQFLLQYVVNGNLEGVAYAYTPVHRHLPLFGLFSVLHLYCRPMPSFRHKWRHSITVPRKEVSMLGRLSAAFVVTLVLAASSVSMLASSAHAEAGSTASPNGLSDADVGAIKGTFKKSTDALVQGNLDVWSDFWTEDAILMPPGHRSVTGLPKLVEFARGSLADLKALTQSDWTFEGRGDLAVVSTEMTWTYKDGTTKNGKQVVALLKDGNSVWKAQKAIFNLDGGS